MRVVPEGTARFSKRETGRRKFSAAFCQLIWNGQERGVIMEEKTGKSLYVCTK